MKPKNILLSSIFLLAMFSCNGGKTSTSDLITVDVTADYPEKELVLQDIFDVEYVPLETTDEFVTKAMVKAVSDHYVLTSNWGKDGNLYLFDRTTGKGIRVINRFGQSGEEYGIAVKCLIDETQEELYVFDAMARRVLVYDLTGRFKRNFKFVGEWQYDETYDYDAEHLLCYVTDMSVIPEKSCHLLISKQDGRVVREISLPYEGEPVELIARQGNKIMMGSFNLTLSKADGWELINPSADTIYHLGRNGRLTPDIVRTPSVHTMDPVVFLTPTAMTDRHIFFHTMKRYYSVNGLTHQFYIYDKVKKSIHNYTLSNSDFIDGHSDPIFRQLLCYPLVSYLTLQAPDLVEAYQAGKLQSRLKEIAAGLDEEDNAVIMLVKYKEN